MAVKRGSGNKNPEAQFARTAANLAKKGKTNKKHNPKAPRS